MKSKKDSYVITQQNINITKHKHNKQHKVIKHKHIKTYTK